MGNFFWRFQTPQTWDATKAGEEEDDDDEEGNSLSILGMRIFGCLLKKLSMFVVLLGRSELESWKCEFQKLFRPLHILDSFIYKLTFHNDHLTYYRYIIIISLIHPTHSFAYFTNSE